MDDTIIQFLNAHGAAYLVTVFTALTFIMPQLEKLADSTANKWDNKIVGFLAEALRFVPRIRLGR